MKELYLSIILVILLVFSPSVIFAQEVTTQPTPTTSAAEREYQFLKEQAQEFRGFIERERSQHQDFLQTYLTYLGILGSLAVFFGLGSYWKALNDAKKIGAKGVASAIRENAGEVQSVIEETTRRIVNEKLNLNKKILIVGNIDTDFSQGEIEKLNKRGFKNVKSEEYSDDIVIKDYDLIIFPYSKSKNDNLSSLIERLNNERAIPVIAYAPSKNDPVNNPAFDKYEWRGFANSPLTLVSQTFMVISSSN